MTLSFPRHLPQPIELARVAESTLPTELGTFRALVYRAEDPTAHPSLSNEHIALVLGDVEGTENLPVRAHSECLTGEVFSSLKCDCRDQLREAQRIVQQMGRGVIIYLRQEGRGIGLANKIRAYALQEQGADTIEANQQLDLPVDARSYAVAAMILEDLGVRSVQLITNNPAKISALSRHGIPVRSRIPVVVSANAHSSHYLDVKRDRMSHMLPGAPAPSVPTDGGWVAGTSAE